MDKTDAVNIAFLAGVVIVLVASFVYVNVFWEEPEEDEESEDETDSFFDISEDVPKDVGTPVATPYAVPIGASASS